MANSAVPRFWRRAGFALGALLWAAGVGAGMKALYDHSGIAGESADAPSRFPEASAIRLDPKRPTLVLLAHPFCPCTKASIGELAVLMRRLEGRVSAHVLFVEPPGAVNSVPPEQWSDAARISGVSVTLDRGGREAARLGARTSGQAVLYSPGGKLLFSGGITPGRGHMGENVGIDRVVSLVTSGASDRAESAVYGCSIFDKDRT